MKKTIMIIPPCIDWSMPLLSCPLLKPYLDEKYDVEIIDLNVDFFNEVFSSTEYYLAKHRLRQSIDSHELLDSIHAALSLMQKVSRCDFHESEYLLMRKVHILKDWMHSDAIYKFLENNDCTTEKIIKKILQNKIPPDSSILAFCISISVEDQIVPSMILTKIFRQRFPKTKIVIGGNIVSRIYKALSESKLSKYYDVLCVGEGEVSLPNALAALESNTISDYPHIVLSENQNFDFSQLKRADFSWCEFNKYLSCYPILPITINRKCDWGKCDFCAIHSCWLNKTRYRSMDLVIQDIKYYIENYNIKYFRIIDENISPKLFEEFADALLENNISIFYEAYTRFSKQYNDPSLAAKLYKSGCRQLFWGIESINDNVLKKIKKGTTSEIIDTNLNIFAKNGILNYCFILTGIPSIDSEYEKETIEYVTTKKEIHVAAIGSFVVDRLSPMEVDIITKQKYGITLFGKGDMTTEVGFLFNNEDISANVKSRTEKYIESIYKQRGDYALTAMLDEETRLILCSVFGNNFAQSAYDTLTTEEKEFINLLSIERSTEERVFRSSKRAFDNT